MTAKILTQARLKEILHYSPDTGIFIRVIKNAHNARSGCIDACGYRVIGVDGIRYLAHRLAHLYIEEALPENQVDHINHVRDDNRWSNLRKVTHKENQRNTPLRSTNTSGYVGVNWVKEKKLWKAVIKVNGKNKHLGYFKEKMDAVAARIEGNKKYGFHMNHGQ